MKLKQIIGSILICYSIASYADVYASSNESYPLDTVIWQNLNIPVCWENISADAFLRGEVQNAVQSTWEDNSQLDFTGWGQCPTGFFNGIRIGVEDTGAHVKALGNDLINIRNGMVLNFTMQKWNELCPDVYGVTNCVRWIAVHEFGHALGFAHEQNRPDTPDYCTENAQGTSGNAIFTEWDRDSIMNYCNPNYNGFGNLSAIDILTVQTYYGRIPTYSLARTLQIPVVQVGAARYSASLSDIDGDGKFRLYALFSTANQSSRTPTYQLSTSVLNLPLVKVIDGSNHVVSLYSAIMQRHSDGKFSILSISLLQPVPTTN